MFIDKIVIKNFRSIVDQTIDANNLVIFVGKNDVGKSNILRALNLFFNGETDSNAKFNFQTDFSKLAKIGKNKAKEVTIRVTLSPPATFRDYAQKIEWTKKWRGDGSFVDGEKIRFANGAAITKRSRLYTWIRRLNYHYVPAIKSKDYFSKLLSKLYETLYATIKNDLQGAGQAFVDRIRDHTTSLSKELLVRLSLDSKIQLPENLSSLFSTLDFETNFNNDIISLNNRGDGVKVRHIPIILKFLADKEELHHPKGAVRSNTIWGYEEPENNLELQQAFELSHNFKEYSDEIQIFLTTHSPAFYSVEQEHERVTKFHTIKNTTDSSTEYTKIDGKHLRETDTELGLMPLVTPYIKEKNEENFRLHTIIDDLRNTSKPVLLVEGPTDKVILENAWNKLNPSKRMPFIIQPSFDCFFIANTFKRCDTFRKHKNRLFIGLLDFDEAFECWQQIRKTQKKDNAKYELVEQNHHIGLTLRHLEHKAFICLLPVPEHRKTYASEKFGKSSQLSIELLFTDEKLHGFIEEIECPGGGIVKRMIENKKQSFADQSINFTPYDFSNINPIFLHIENIIAGKYR